MTVPLSWRYEIDYPSAILRAGGRRYKQVGSDVVAVKNHRSARGGAVQTSDLGSRSELNGRLQRRREVMPHKFVQILILDLA